MKKFLFPIVGAIIAFVLSSAIDAEAQNCPLDWHPPPCGKPPEPVKSPLIDIIKQAAKYHQEYAAQIWGMVAASTCVGTVGEPRVDQARAAACMIGASLGAINLGMQKWETLLLEAINGASPQEVVIMPPELASFDFDTEGDPYLEALADHQNAIGYFGDLIVDSVRITFDCDAWAQYDVRGIECGDNQRAWTEQLLRWQGEKYSAVSSIEDYLADQLAADLDMGDMKYDAEVSGWEGWWLQQ